MKALQSKLASELLADPSASNQLRRFLMNQRSGIGTEGDVTAAHFEFRRGNGMIRVKATFVPKAKVA